MIAHNDEIVASFVVIAVVVGCIIQCSRLLFTLGADIINGLILENLLALVFREIIDLAAFENSYEEVSEQIWKNSIRTYKQGRRGLQEGWAPEI